MNLKTKKKLIIALLSIIIVVVSGLVGANIYVDSILNKMNQKDEFAGDDVNANKLKGNVENIVLIGADADDENGSRADAIKIISLDFDSKKIKISSIQRDNAMYLASKERYEKINHSYRYDGAKGLLTDLNYNLDLDATKYAKFSFDALQHVVDIVGGVDIALSAAEAAEIGLNGAGTFHLSGEQALSYARIRNLDSDYGRMARQNNVINGVVGAVGGKSPFELLDIVQEVMPYIETNVSNGTIKSYASKLISFDLGNIEQYQFPSGGYESILASLYLYNAGPHYVLKDFKGEVEILHKNIYGKKYKASKNVEKVDKETKKLAGY